MTDRSFALHQMKRTREALDLLLPVLNQFPKEWLVPFCLACYAAQLGQVGEARCWLEKSFRIHDPMELKMLALNDQDLEPLWPQIAEIAARMSSRKTDFPKSCRVLYEFAGDSFAHGRSIS